MNKNLLKSISCGLITILSLCSSNIVLANFEGKQVNVRWEIWDKKNPGQGGAVLAVRDERDVVASNVAIPDIKDFHRVHNDFELWDVDFTSNVIEMTYTSINVQDFDHQYMHLTSMGFHFEDTENNLPDITGVTLAPGFNPFGFNPALISFDANNIYVDLNGSMCHTTAMSSMPTCTNPESPTGYNNKIKLNVTFAASVNPMDNTQVDKLFDWAEATYPQFFPNKQSSVTLQGYYVRYYPQTDVYIGVKEGIVYVLGKPFGGLLKIDTVAQLLQNAGL
ncbi:MAG: hypothetical protein KAU26_05745 [Methylococcales bacterium]|nr:hypothetical protein [Methylococcales bacterium]